MNPHLLPLVLGKKGLGGRVRAILAKYGTDAHVYLPGIGVINGLTAGNYLDSAGTTAATVDNPVGLVLDGAGSVGAELLQNTWFSLGAGWSGSGNSVTYTGSSSANATNGNILTTLSTYKISFTTTGNVRVYCGATNSVYCTAGTYTFYLENTGGGSSFYFQSQGSSIVVSNISVKKVTGIHATQATTANKPILRRGAVNFITYSEDLTNAAWTKSGATCPAADTLLASAGAGGHTVLQSPAGTKLGFNTISVELKSGTNTKASVGLWSNETGWNAGAIVDAATRGCLVDLSAGTILATDAGISSAITAMDDGWYRVSITNTTAFTSATNNQARFYVAPNTATLTSNTSFTAAGTESVLIRKAQLEVGSTASTYIPTTTAPASSSSGNYHWVHDSTDVLTATFPAGYESATTINASTAGQSTLTAQNIVGAYNIGPSIDTYGRFIFRTGLTASELTIMQTFANRLAGV